MDVYFGFLFLGFGGRRRIYHSSVTFFLFCGWINRCLLLLASHKQRKGTKHVNIPCHTFESRLGPKVDGFVIWVSGTVGLLSFHLMPSDEAVNDQDCSNEW